MLLRLIIGLCFSWAALCTGQPQSVKDLVPLSKIEGIILEPRYFTANNFVGEAIEGYHQPELYLSAEAFAALKKAQEYFAGQGYQLKIFDAYRPQMAVDHFVRWAQNVNDTATKAAYYPTVAKNRLFAEGYIAEKSGHSRASTVDLTLVDLATVKELDMGTPFDFFGPESWPSSKAVSEAQFQNRQILRQVMVAHGFKPLPTEWWHFTLEAEPYPNTYFNFPIK
jgi:D-alanyl-D-alanine dipeptidase